MLHLFELLHETLCSLVEENTLLVRVAWEREFILFIQCQCGKKNSAEEFKSRRVLDQRSILRKRKHFRKDVQVKPAEAGLLLTEHVASCFVLF